MRSTFFGLNIGYRGLQAQQRALDVTSHNIANANTQGYTRQDVIMKASTPIKVLEGYVGTGVDVAEFRRIRDQFLDIQIRTENKTLGEWETRSDILSKLEVIFNEPSDSSLRSVMDDYWESWQTLSKDPESIAVRASVMQSGVTLADTFNHMSRQFEELQEDINKSIGIKVDEINSLGRQIRDLNVQVIKAESDGSKANDLRDRRDLLVEQLSKIVDIGVVEDDIGSITVSIGGRSLVSRAYVTEMKFTEHETDPSAATLEWIDSYTGAGVGAVNIKGGVLKGYISMRDEQVPRLQNEISELAKRIAIEVNNLHHQGYALDSTQGVDFFVKIDEAKPFSAGNIRVNQSIIDNANLLAAGLTNPVSTGDGSNALLIAQLKNKAMINPGAITQPTSVTGTALSAPISVLAGRGASITGSVDLSGGLDLSALAPNNSLTLSLNGLQRTITLTGDYTGDPAGLAAYLQNQINAAYSSGAVTVSIDGGTGQLSIQDNKQTDSSSTLTVIGGGTAEALFGANWASGDITTTAGQDANNRLTMNIDGAVKTLELTPGTYNNLTDMVTELQTQIDSAFGAGVASVTLTGGNELVITSLTPGPYQVVSDISGPGAELLGMASKYTAKGDDFYRSTVALLGVTSQEAERMLDNQTLLTEQLINKREGISGVSLDEEMANMIKFQHAYAASARVINAMDEMLELIVNRLGLVGR